MHHFLFFQWLSLFQTAYRSIESSIKQSLPTQLFCLHYFSIFKCIHFWLNSNSLPSHENTKNALTRSDFYAVAAVSNTYLKNLNKSIESIKKQKIFLGYGILPQSKKNAELYFPNYIKINWIKHKTITCQSWGRQECPDLLRFYCRCCRENTYISFHSLYYEYILWILWNNIFEIGSAKCCKRICLQDLHSLKCKLKNADSRD